MAYNALPNRKDKYVSGKYNLINESKYVSDPSKIIYRSSLELKMCKVLDKTPSVLKWGSEIIGIPYTYYNFKTKRQENHTYYMDFYVELETDTPEGMEKIMIEVKPHSEFEKLKENTPPPKPKKMTPTSLRNWEYALSMFIINKHKWVAAQEYAKRRHMKFFIVTEKTLNKLFR